MRKRVDYDWDDLDFNALRKKILDISKKFDQEERTGGKKKGLNNVDQHDHDNEDDEWAGFVYDEQHDCYINETSYDDGQEINAVRKGKG